MTQPKMPARPGGSDRGDLGVTNSAPSPRRPTLGRLGHPKTAADHTGWMRWLPGLQTLRGYQTAWLRHDIVAGLVLTTMLVPVGIAYAVASGVLTKSGATAPAGCCVGVRSIPRLTKNLT